MKFNLEIKVTGLEQLINDLKAYLVSNKNYKKEQRKAFDEAIEKSIENQDAKEFIKTVSLEEVRTKLATLAQSGKQESVKKLIKKYGGSKLSEIDPMHFEKLLKDAEEIQ